MDMKICFVASSGGHWEELICLKEIAEENEAFFVTESGCQTEEWKDGNLHVYPQINRRERGFPVHFIKLCMDAWRLMRKERPDVVIATGALISVPFCFFGKRWGAKVIFIESIARVDNRSLSGRLVYPIADRFLVQWESMLRIYPKAINIGGLF